MQISVRKTRTNFCICLWKFKCSHPLTSYKQKKKTLLTNKHRYFGYMNCLFGLPFNPPLHLCMYKLLTKLTLRKPFWQLSSYTASRKSEGVGVWKAELWAPMHMSIDCISSVRRRNIEFPHVPHSSPKFRRLKARLSLMPLQF